MRYFLLISFIAAFLLTACDSRKKPSSSVFTTEINQYLERHGRSCTSIGRQFPIDIPASAQQSQYGFGPQLAALQQAGLVSETDTTARVHGMLDSLRGSTPPQPVRRYQLTAEGQKYFQNVSGSLGQTGALCYGQKTVDSILKWSDPVTMDGYSQVEITYTYKFVDLAPWAERPDVQHAFPDIQATLNGASKTTQVIGVQLTNKGWEVPGS